MSLSRENSTPLEAAEEVMLVPPVSASASVRRLISSEPVSPVTVRAVPTLAVVTAVTRPLSLTVTTGIWVCEPKEPVSLLTVARVSARSTLPEPLKETAEALASPEALKLRAVSSTVAVSALPVRSPTKPEEAVTIPVAVTLVREMSASRATSTPLEAALVVTFVPPVIDSASVRRLISSEPLSPVTVSAVPTEAVLMLVTRPLASTVTTGISVCEP